MTKFDLLIIGAGPGGYVAAIRAAQLGMTVALIDKRDVPGGACLNVGCIPSKALLHSSHLYWQAQNQFAKQGIVCEGLHVDLPQMLANKATVVEELTRGVAFLLRKNKITFIHGQASLTDGQTVTVGKTVYTAKFILIATGATPFIPEGITVDEQQILTSTGALSLAKVPKHLVIIGGGYIGLELGSVWARLGAAVTIVDSVAQIANGLDDEVAAALQKALAAQGITFQLGHRLSSIKKTGAKVEVSVTPVDSQKTISINCDAVLLAMGRRPVTAELGLAVVGIQVDERGRIPVNKQWQTTCATVYAIGDVTPGPMLAHRAGEEGVAVAEQLADQAGHVDYDVIPAVVFTSPEVASVGKTEQQLQKEGMTYRVGRFPFSANSRAKACGETQGFVKILTEEATDRIVGVHIIGEMAGTLISEATLAMAFGASAEDVARTCHAHPTHAEAVKEAALAAFSQALHV
jgi:dihydrolipoamide dehydrogenase